MKNAKKQLMTQLLILGTCGALTLAACAPTVAQRGNMLEDFQIESVKAGESTRSDVLRALGSPTTKSPFDERTWYYIGQETEKRGILDPEVVKERIIVVNFDAEGFVVSINEAKNGRVDIPYARSKTPTHGNDDSLLQEFLGNLGKFNPQDELGQ